jgi:sugar-specific transcriptional regulator TrmB
MKNQSVKAKVLACIERLGQAKAGDIIKTTKCPANQVYTALSKLLKSGELDRLGREYIINPNPDAVPTAVDETKTVSMKQLRDVTKKLSEGRKATVMEMELGHKVNALQDQIEKLQKAHHEINVKYYDAMAIVRYLETKVIAQFGK